MSLLFLTLVGLSGLMLVAVRWLFPRDLTLMEIVLLFGGSLVLTLSTLSILFLSNVHDTNILNGRVVSKKMERVSCRHSYECNCVTYGEGDNQTTICQTCYEHPYDQDWIVRTTLGNYDIDTRDSQGLIEPTFWTKAQANDPVAREESVINYLKASPQSLFNQTLRQADQKAWDKQLPAYPRVHTYYEINRVAAIGVNYPERGQLNDELNRMLETVGPARQVNVVVVVINTMKRDYKNVLERHWNGAKKNDVVVVLGTDAYPKIAWADAFSFAKSAKNELLMVKLRNGLEDVGTLQNTMAITQVIRDNINKNFNRQPMSHFKYLRYDYVPSGWSLLIACLIYALCFGGALLYCLNNDVHDNG